jgi:acetyltransferase-like isoleucine patch superfamily enzyme
VVSAAAAQVHWRLLLARLLCAPLPPFVLGRVKLALLRFSGVTIGRGSNFWALPVLLGPGDVGARLRIGDACGFNVGCLFDLTAKVTIADRVSVGHQVRFLTSATASGRPGPAPIVVGDGAWIGARCTILSGVTIGAGAVIGAGVTVASDVPAHLLVTGSQNVSLARWR